MPNKKSAKKELRKGQKRAKLNESIKSNLKTLHKQTVKAISAKETRARELATQTIKALDKAAGKGIIKKNNAARTKSRLQQKLNQLAAKK
jgi:small subunit ribosomal protein S20